MNETVLKALMKLFAIVADVNREGFSGNEKDVIAEYLQRQFSREHVLDFLKYYEESLPRFHPETMYENEVEANKQNVHNETIIRDICNQINEELEQEHKVIVILYLLDFINRGEAITDNEIKFVNTVGNQLKIPQDEFEDAEFFTFEQIDKIKHKENLLFIDSKESSGNDKIKHLQNEKLDGRIVVLRMNSTNTFVFRYYGNHDLFLNGHNIKSRRSYIWSVGSVIKSPKAGSFYYTRVAGKFIQAITESKFIFTAENIEYKYPRSNNGIHRFNFTEESGRLIGIIGGSGSGKSTLLNVLNGNLKLKRGTIKINDYDIHKDYEFIKGLIGYVPQDDLLFKELTVYQNLYYNAKLCFDEFTEKQMKRVVEDALVNFDLIEARNLRVGDAVNTILSGGQRKRLNIALELMREPAILFVDEPTSGLSSADSEKVMTLLKRQTFKGRLVIANIHQPSSDIFKLLDKLLVVDQGGRVIYYGNPIEAITYFKGMSLFVDAEESECKRCGNINAEQILRIVESRVVDVNGRLTRRRKTTPQEWYEIYMTRIDPHIQKIKRTFISTLPKSSFKLPGHFDQFKIYFKRDLLAKLSNRQYMLLTILEAPLLAIILAFFTKNYTKNETNYMYIFGENTNIPAYLFMAVIVALFLGMVLSAEEIFKDRKILKREKFLNLSRFSYLSSKISIVFAISAIQMMIFVIIGNQMLEIHGMMFKYWLILFTTACWANIIGLNISSGLNSVVTIYILVPLILVPQLLFSGVVVEYSAMNKKIKNEKYVPLIGDIITSRWSYEALMVTQHKYNRFDQKFFPVDQKIDEAIYHKAYVLPYLETRLQEVKENVSGTSFTKNPKTQQNISLICNEMLKIQKQNKIVPQQAVTKLCEDTVWSQPDISFLNQFLEEAEKHYQNIYQAGLREKEVIYAELIENLGSSDAFVKFKQNYHNKKLVSIMRKDNEINEFVDAGNELIRVKSNIYRYPESRYGRAHFYAPAKMIGELKVDTLVFNLVVIWLMTMFLFVALYYDWLRKVINYFEHLRINRLNRKFLKVLRQYESRRY